MTKRVSALAIQKLKEALCVVYWYKNDLRSFLQNCITDAAIVAHVDWSGYKRQIVSDVVDLLCANQDKYLGDIRRLIHEVCKMDGFSHLAQLENGDAKVQSARLAVMDLRRMVEDHDAVAADAKKALDRRTKTAEKAQTRQAVRENLDKIKQRYFQVVAARTHQERGYELEKIMLSLFNLFDLDPRASFRNVGEQIDGAFTLEGTDYLFEAKWQNERTAIQDLDGFAGKVQRKLDNTLGLFLSINGFSEDGIRAHSSGRPVIILMTGADLMAVLEERIDFVTLLLRKRRHAAQSGNILIDIHEILQ